MWPCGHLVGDIHLDPSDAILDSKLEILSIHHVRSQFAYNKLLGRIMDYWSEKRNWNELPKMLKLRYVRFRPKYYAVSKLYTKGIGLCVLLSRKINSMLTFLGLLRGRKDHPLVLEESNSKFEHGIVLYYLEII